MEEKSGISQKLLADTVISAAPSPAVAAGRTDAKAKRHAAKAKNKRKSKRMRVIEGGARKRPPDVKDHIAQQLKAVYDDILKQPVPARFMDLLHELASKSKLDGE